MEGRRAGVRRDPFVTKRRKVSEIGPLADEAAAQNELLGVAEGMDLVMT